jgi:hypothetical protein
VTHKAWQVLEVTPEAIDLFGTTIHDATAMCMNPAAAIAAELHGTHDVEGSDSEYIGGSECNSPELRLGRRSSSAETDQIERVTCHTRPNAFCWVFLRKDRDTGSKLTESVQSY